MLYFLILGFQVLCIWHLIKTNKPQWWIWLIIFVPVVGCTVYLFSEIFNKNDVQHVQNTVTNLINPSKKIKTLQDQLAFSETFENKLALANAYLESKFIDEAIALYEEAAVGIFKDNPDLHKKLITAYYEKGNHKGLLNSAEVIYNEKNFKHSPEHLLYTLTLDELAIRDKAYQEFKSMDIPYKNYNHRVHFARFLKRTERPEEASKVYQAIIDESKHLGKPEYGLHREWILAAYEEI